MASNKENNVVFIMDKRTVRKEFKEVFQRGIEETKSELAAKATTGDDISRLSTEDGHNIRVVVRKRPMIEREVAKGSYDAVTVLNHQTLVAHDCRVHADQKHKYLDNYHLNFDCVFDDNESTEQVYDIAVRPLVEEVCRGGHATCLMYGQTGTGKTFTMSSIEELAAVDIFEILKEHEHLAVSLSFIEVTGSRVNDLLNDSKEVRLCQNAQGVTEVLGATEIEANHPEQLLEAIEAGKTHRRTAATEVNDGSSRSHAIARIVLREGQEMIGQLTLVDLAGSEWNSDSANHDLERRKEGAEINASLMALKECLRGRVSASTSKSGTVFLPYRNSKLTTLLKDSFSGTSSYVTVIATITPIASEIDHTISTLKFAKTVTEENSVMKAQQYWIEEKIDKVEPVQKWSHETLKSWMSKTNKGFFAKYAANLPSNVDGKAFSRFALPRLTQICDKDTNAAQLLLNAWRAEMARIDKQTSQAREVFRGAQRGGAAESEAAKKAAASASGIRKPSSSSSATRRTTAASSKTFSIRSTGSASSFASRTGSARSIGSRT